MRWTKLLGSTPRAMRGGRGFDSRRTVVAPQLLRGRDHSQQENAQCWVLTDAHAATLSTASGTTCALVPFPPPGAQYCLLARSRQDEVLRARPRDVQSHHLQPSLD